MGKRKSPYTTRLDPDVATAVDRYGEDHGLTQSEAVRRLVERGLEAGDGPTTDDIDELKDMVRGLEAEREDADETDRNTTVEFGRDGDDGDTETETLKNASIGPAIEVIQVVLLMVIVVVVVGGV